MGAREFREGERYLVLPGAKRFGGYAGADHNVPSPGTVVTIRAIDNGSVVDFDGDVRVRWDGGGWGWILPEYLAPVDEDPTPVLGTATLRVDVRLFVGETDVTDLLAPTVLAALKETQP